MKPSNKKWLSQHSAHDYPLLMARWKTLAKKTGLDLVVLADQSGYKIIALRGGEKGADDGLYLSAGVHGDEPASVWGLLEWAEANQRTLRQENIVILPCVNPWGFVNNLRFDRQGRDLNRMFQNKTLPFFRAWRELIGDQQFRVVLNLHEDFDSQGVYVYELVPRGVRVSDSVLDQIECIIPRESRKRIEGRIHNRGVVRRSGNIKRLIEKDLDGGWPEAIYLFMNHTKVALTFETPSEFAFYERVRSQKRFIDEVLASEGSR